MFRSNPVINRFKRFFSLPYYYFETIHNEECTRSQLGVALDLLELFFRYKTFPDHYGQCRLWEVEKSQWKYYYGHIFQTYQMLLLKKVQPREYDILFCDKAVCELLCKGIGVRDLPHTYGSISPDQDYKEGIKSWFEKYDVDSLFIKPLKGGRGLGIVLAKKINNHLFIQSTSKLTPLQDFHLSKISIVQEVIKQDSRMSAFSSSSVNTIRIVTMYTKKESVIILAAIMLCGVGESYISNWAAGGINIGIDRETGRLQKFGYDKKGTRYREHPTSRVTFEGFIIPQWQRIIDLAIKIQKALPCYRILGIDVALQESGEPILIEVNENPGFIPLEQSCGPLLRVEQNCKAFGEYDLFYNRHQKELYARLEK